MPQLSASCPANKCDSRRHDAEARKRLQAITRASKYTAIMRIMREHATINSLMKMRGCSSCNSFLDGQIQLGNAAGEPRQAICPAVAGACILGLDEGGHSADALHSTTCNAVFFSLSVCIRLCLETSRAICRGRRIPGTRQSEAMALPGFRCAQIGVTCWVLSLYFNSNGDSKPCMLLADIFKLSKPKPRLDPSACGADRCKG